MKFIMTQLGKMQTSKNFNFRNLFIVRIKNIILILLVFSQVTIFAQNSSKRLATSDNTNAPLMDAPTAPTQQRRGLEMGRSPNPYREMSPKNDCARLVYANVLLEYVARLPAGDTKFALQKVAASPGNASFVYNNVYYEYPLPASYISYYEKQCEKCHKKNTPENQPSGQSGKDTKPQNNTVQNQVETTHASQTTYTDPRIDAAGNRARVTADYYVGEGTEILLRNGDTVDKQIEQRGLEGTVVPSTKRTTIQELPRETPTKPMEQKQTETNNVAEQTKENDDGDK